MNEENTAASPVDAPASAPAQAPAPTPEPGTTSAAPAASAASSTRSTSRFYSRFGRNPGSAAPAAAQTQASPSLSTEGLTPEQAVHLKDNLPVRATAGAMADSYQPGESSEGGERRFGRDRDRGDRGDRGGDRGGERFGRGRDRSARFEQSGERSDRGERGRDRDRPPAGTSDRPRRDDSVDSPVARTVESEAPVASIPEAPPAESAPVASVPEAPKPIVPPAPEAPRRVRFEDHNPNDARRTVQEFRPSRDSSYAEEAGRARREQDARKDPAPAQKSSGLFGWMKSILGSKPADESTGPGTSTPSRQERPRGQGHGPAGQDRGPRRDRPQGGGGGQPGGERGGPGGEGGEGGGRRRRRRRGGRNRNRGEGGGDRGGQGGES